MHKEEQANNKISPLMAKLSTYIAGARSRKLPREVAERAKIHLLDGFATLVSGSRLFPGKAVIKYVRRQSGKPEAGVVGTSIVTTAVHAALANGVFGHANETDDVHPPSHSHPASSILPATLAMAERQRASGTHMLRALVLGYELNARVLLAIRHKQLTQMGFHCGSKGGVFGGGVAAGLLLNLNVAQTRYLLSYCAQQAAGLRTNLRATEHLEKAYVCGGMTAQHGVEAALMVESGFTGVEDVFTGQHNFLDAFSRDPEPEALVRRLGKDFEIMRCAIKRWSAGAPIQAPLHLLYELMQRERFRASDVVKLTARIPDKELQVVDNREMGEITVQHLLAVMLIDGTVTFKSAHDRARIRDPRVLKLRRNQIECIGDPSLTNPDRDWRCVMEVKLKNGRTLHHETMAAKGGHQNPLTPEEEREKALDLFGPVLGTARSQRLMTALLNIDKVKDVRALRKLYTA